MTRPYQSFGSTAGDSDSAGKLEALKLPPLDGLSFLDLGCNEGFFCLFALKSGASRVVGIDLDPTLVESARARCPDCDFEVGSFDNWNDSSKYDVILLASAIHYSHDQEALIHKLVRKLTPKGVLVLEMGFAEGSESKWVNVKRAIDTRLFATRAKIEDILSPYAYKVLGRSVNQVGDPNARWVVHVKRREPVAMMLMGPPNTGKTTISRTLFDRTSDLNRVSFDDFFFRLGNGSLEVSKHFLNSLAMYDQLTEGDKIIAKILSQSELLSEFISCIIPHPSMGDILVDGYIPEDRQFDMVAEIRARGFFPWILSSAPILSPKPKVATEVLDVDGRSYVVCEAVSGVVDGIRKGRGGIQISGWAVSKPSGRPIEKFIITVFGQVFPLVVLTRPERPDVVSAGFASSNKVGFDAHIADRSTAAKLLELVDPGLLGDSLRVIGLDETSSAAGCLKMPENQKERA